MTVVAWKLYIGTILLEAARHAKDKHPSYRVSEWIAHFAAAGFDGMELWEYHATLAGTEEQNALIASTFPIAVFNSYASMDAEGRADRVRATEFARRLGARAIKFNVGKDTSKRGVYLAALRQWRGELPKDICLLCECHPGSIVEEPAEAKRFFDDAGIDGWGVIVHPLNRLESLQPWFDAFGPAVRHAHLQMRQDDRTVVRFDERPERARRAVQIMRNSAFDGSCTFEFARGMNAPGENIDDLLANALLDLAFLKEVLRQ